MPPILAPIRGANKVRENERLELTRKSWQSRGKHDGRACSTQLCCTWRSWQCASKDFAVISLHCLWGYSQNVDRSQKPVFQMLACKTAIERGKPVFATHYLIISQSGPPLWPTRHENPKLHACASRRQGQHVTITQVFALHVPVHLRGQGMKLDSWHCLAKPLPHDFSTLVGQHTYKATTERVLLIWCVQDMVLT